MASEGILEGFRKPLATHLAEVEVKTKNNLNNLELYRKWRPEYNEEKEQLKKKILLKKKNIENLKNTIAKIKNENAERRQCITNFETFVQEREDSIKNIEIINSAISNNTSKKTSLIERRSNYKRFKMMYDFKVRCLFQGMYSVFNNLGTQSLKNTLASLKKLDQNNLRSVEQVNTAVGYIVLFIIVASKICRLNYACMYRFFGSRSSIMLKDKNRMAIGAYIEGRTTETGKKMFLGCVTLDATKILELFRIDNKEMRTILEDRDLHKFLDCLRRSLFARMFGTGIIKPQPDALNGSSQPLSSPQKSSFQDTTTATAEAVTSEVTQLTS